MTKNRILYFDDDKITAKIVANELKSYHWEINVVSTIEDFFLEIQYNDYDGIIMDIIAPISTYETDFIRINKIDIKKAREGQSGMSTGIILTEKVWEKKDYADLPVLFYSMKKKIAFKPIEGKKWHYLHKPSLIKNINEELCKLLTP